MSIPDANPEPEPDRAAAAEPEPAAGAASQASADAASEASAGAEPEAGTGPPPPEPTEEELQAAWEEQLKHITVTDILVQTAVSLVNLAGRRLGLGPDGEAERDLDEVRGAIDAVRALVPVLEKSDIGPTMKPLRDALSSLQFEYAKLAPKAAAGPGATGGSASTTTTPTGPDPASRLWVPGR